MPSSDIPFAKLRSVLLGLGFVEREVEGKYPGYYHAETDTLFVFRPYRPGDPVASYNLIEVRKMLDARGLMEADTFDNQFKKTSA
jgi:hypothetical protein